MYAVSSSMFLSYRFWFGENKSILITAVCVGISVGLLIEAFFCRMSSMTLDIVSGEESVGFFMQ